MLRLRKLTTGEFVHNQGTPNETRWALADWSNPEDAGSYNCTQCGDPIDGTHFMCLDDGSDNCHVECVMVENASYSDGAYILDTDIPFGPDIDLPVPDFG